MAGNQEINGPHPLAPGEYFVICPYDNYHKITNFRIMYHLQKCRRNYMKSQLAKGLEVEYGYCKFNYIHHLPLIEIPFHESRCDDQYSVLQHISYHTSADFLEFRNKQVAKVEEHKEDMEKAMEEWKEMGLVEEEEEWEEDNTVPAGYNPRAKMSNEPVLFAPKCLTKSEKRRFRDENREKFTALVAKKSMEGGPKTNFVMAQPGSGQDAESLDLMSWVFQDEMEPSTEETWTTTSKEVSTPQSSASVSHTGSYKWTSDDNTRPTTEGEDNGSNISNNLNASLQSLAL